MQVTSISSVQPTYNYSNQQAKKQAPSFEGWKINGDKILKANSGELRNYAEHFYRLEEKELREISTVKTIFGFNVKSMSLEAYTKLRNATREVLTNIWDWKARINYIDELEEKGKRLSGNDIESRGILRKWVAEIEDKAASCRDKYYETEPARESDSSCDLSPETLARTHYDY